jgi:excisionase family DNA binding protein
VPADPKPELIEELRALLPETPQARAALDRLQRELHPDRLLTTREAADILGIRLVNTLKALLKAEKVPTVKVGTHTRVARRALERLRESRRLAAIQASDRQWDEVDAAFGSEGLTQEQMDALSETRPGTLPWKRS